MRTRDVAVSTLAAVLVACAGRRARAGAAPETGTDPQRLDALAGDYFATWVRTFPVIALFSGIPDAPDERLDENSLGGIRGWREREDRWLSELRTIDATALEGRPQEVTYGVLRELLEAS